MNVGTHSDGRPVDYDHTTGQFTIGDQAVSASQVRLIHETGQLSWQSSTTASWFESSFPAAPDLPVSTSSSAPPKKRAGLIVAIIVGALILAVGGVAAALIVSRPQPTDNPETAASIPSLEFIDPSSLTDPNVAPGTVLPAGSYKVFMTGERIQTVQWVEDAGSGNGVAVLLTFDAEGASRLREFTSQHLQQPIPIAIGGKVIFAPVVIEPITDGRVQLVGNEDMRQILGPTIVPTR